MTAGNRLWGLICILVVADQLAAGGTPAALRLRCHGSAGDTILLPTPRPPGRLCRSDSNSRTGAGAYNTDVSDIEIWHFWASPVRRNGLKRIIAMCQQKLPNITVTDTVKPFGDI